MTKEDALILWFKDIRIEDVPLVGGKNAALGEMYVGLTKQGIRVPNGFAVTAAAYRFFLREAGIGAHIEDVLKGLDTHDVDDLGRRGALVRKTILDATLPDALAQEITKAYADLSTIYMKRDVDVAVRSSATAEDLPDASFAGQQETYLNVMGPPAVLEAVKKCIASLFTNRAISYRADKGFSHTDVALSVAVQKMVRSDLSSSGVMFTIDTETGFDKVVVIDAVYGLGEMIVQGKITPDEFLVFKPLREKGFRSIIARDLGKKDQKLVYGAKGTKAVKVPQAEQEEWSLTDDEVLTLADWGIAIEKYFSAKHHRFQPMDIEWAKDGRSGELFIVQARPETVHATADKNVYQEYRLKEKGKALVAGIAVGRKIASGPVHVIHDVKKINTFKKDEVLVTEITDPDWEPIMKIAAAIVTDRGGRTSHAAIVSRELGIPCIVGTERATKVLKDGRMITVDCASGEQGVIYDGNIPFDVIEHRLDKLPETRTKLMVNIGAPDEAFKNHFLPVTGVGLGRLEFIINAHIKVHPNALLEYQTLKHARDKARVRVAREIERMTKGYDEKAAFYVDELAEGIAEITAAFWPHEVIIRFSDFKTNEYRTLIGGEFYEPEEENPMLGWRGASRYYDPRFARAFELECRALKKVRDEWGFANVVPMVPFCRTPEEGKKVLDVMKSAGLDRAADKGLKVYVMCEIPSNILRADEFLEIFDGMSIGSNDLTQLTLGLDRDSDTVNRIANENDPAVKNLIAAIIKKCREKKKYIGICGQAPSDFPDFAAFLVREGIESISLNPDTVIKTLERVAEEERSIS